MDLKSADMKALKDLQKVTCPDCGYYGTPDDNGDCINCGAMDISKR